MSLNWDVALADINFETLGNQSRTIRTLVMGFTFVLLILMGYWLDLRSQLTALEQVKKQEWQLRSDFERTQRDAASLSIYRQQLVVVQKTLKDLLKKLPHKTEVPSLLEDITQIGVANGLEFTLFDPQAEIKQDFYTELPVRITVSGDYHHLAQFISQLAGMDRVVTVHNFTLQKLAQATQSSSKPLSPKPSSVNSLQLDMIAKTYRYLGDQKKVEGQDARHR